MPRPVLFDTDMGVDDAVALMLALCAKPLNVIGIATVGGNVSAAQAAVNAGRCLGPLRLRTMPPIAQGLDQPEPGLADAAHIFGADGLGNSDLPPAAEWAPQSGLALYEDLCAQHAGELTIVAIGPLTNLAAVLDATPDVLSQVARIIIMGGAIFCPGNITPKAEFNVWRDPAAAARVLGSDLPITLVPLDVTRKVVIDESHRARLAAGGTRSGQILATMMEFPMAQGIDGPPGRFVIHDALAVGVLLWPELFLQTQMPITVVKDGEERGRTVPLKGRKEAPKASVILSVQVADFLENMLETLCSEAFVV